jgi:hypothetical protein
MLRLLQRMSSCFTPAHQKTSSSTSRLAV